MSESSGWEISPPAFPFRSRSPNLRFAGAISTVAKSTGAFKQGSPHALCLGTGIDALLQTWAADGTKTQAVTLAADQLLDQLCRG